MGSDRNKLLLTLRSQPLLAWTLRAAAAAREVSWIGIISQPADWVDLKEILGNLSLTKPVQLIQGGTTRQESVYNGLQALPADAQQVLIHDGARCLATPELFDRCAVAIRGAGDKGTRGQGGQGRSQATTNYQLPTTNYQLPTTNYPITGLIAAIPVKDTIKVVDGSGLIQNTPDRSQLWAAQTPQAFDVQLLKQCHERGLEQGWEVTDDAALFERCGLPVQIVEGEETNLKLTTPMDLAIAEFILQQRIGNKS